MSLLERLGELGRALLTTETELRHLRDTLSDIRQEVRKVASDLQDVRERVIRLETSRDADRSQMEAEIARFKAEVARAEIRLGRVLSPADEPRALPESEP